MTDRAIRDMTGDEIISEIERLKKAPMFASRKNARIRR